ncbi:MAG: hypothetical protein WBM44_13345 [Waterburya sp.]
METFIEVKKYFARWDLDNSSGRIVLYDADNNELDNRTYTNPTEFQLILEMLRLEKPLYFDDRSKHLRTGFGAAGEPVGEEEGS